MKPTPILLQVLYSTSNNLFYKMFLGNAALQHPYPRDGHDGPQQLTHLPYWSKIALLLQLSRLLQDVPNIWLVWMDDDIVAIDVLGDNLQRLQNEMINEDMALAVNKDYGFAGGVNTGVMVLRLDHTSSRSLIQWVWFKPTCMKIIMQYTLS